MKKQGLCTVGDADVSSVAWRTEAFVVNPCTSKQHRQDNQKSKFDMFMLYGKRCLNYLTAFCKLILGMLFLCLYF